MCVWGGGPQRHGLDRSLIQRDRDPAVRTGRGKAKLIRIHRDTAQHLPTRSPSILRYPPDCVFQKDGASSQKERVIREFCAEKFPNFWKKADWESNSPDLNAIDYHYGGHVQSLVDRKKPMCLGSLKLAIRRIVDSVPLDMLRRSIFGFANRLKKCVQ